MVKITFYRIIFDLLALLLVYLFCQVLLTVVIDPFQGTGFYCTDFSINFPFHASTVNNIHLTLISLVMPLVFIFGTELVRSFVIKKQNELPTNRKKIDYQFSMKCCNGKNLPEPIGNVYINCGMFLLGLVITNTLTNITKLMIGRLRPNFLEICKPIDNPYTTYCNSKTYLIPNKDFQCGNTDFKEVNASRKSFPSGHTSLSFYSMIFLILFIQKVWNCKHMGILKHIIQLSLCSLALYVGLSRIQDNKHHYTDVIAGFLLGTLVAIITYVLLYRFLNKNDYKIEYKPLVRGENGNNDYCIDEDSETRTTENNTLENISQFNNNNF